MPCKARGSRFWCDAQLIAGAVVSFATASRADGLDAQYQTRASQCNTNRPPVKYYLFAVLIPVCARAATPPSVW